MSEAKTTRQEMHEICYHQAMISLRNAYPSKEESELQPAAISIAVRVSTKLDNLFDERRSKK
jgi:hypothetical protein